jgi:hypothetical protein
VESRAEAVRRALRLYSHARAIISDCTEPLAVEWKLSEPQIGKVRQAFESVVGGTGSHPPIPPSLVPTSPPWSEEDTFAQSVHLFLAAIGLEALPDFIALPRDEVGRPIIPQSRVTALVEARDA